MGSTLEALIHTCGLILLFSYTTVLAGAVAPIPTGHLPWILAVALIQQFAPQSMSQSRLCCLWNDLHLSQVVRGESYDFPYSNLFLGGGYLAKLICSYGASPPRLKTSRAGERTFSSKP